MPILSGKWKKLIDSAEYRHFFACFGRDVDDKKTSIAVGISIFFHQFRPILFVYGKILPKKIQKSTDMDTYKSSKVSITRFFVEIWTKIDGETIVFNWVGGDIIITKNC